MSQLPGVFIETLTNPSAYSRVQLDQACVIAAALDRGKLVLAPPPEAEPS